MSTKIFNGYYVPKRDLGDLYQFSQEFKQKINLLSAEILYRETARICAEKFDQLIASGKVPPKPDAVDPARDSLLTTVSLYVMERQRKARTQRDPIFDLECSVVFIPAENKILCLLYAERREFKQIWESMPGVTPYPYWDNTDPPDIPPELWQSRGREWHEALGESGAPTDAGFVIECGNKGFSFSAEHILKHFPTFEERVDAYAAIHSYAQKIKETGQKESYDAYRKTRKWLYETNKGKKALEESKKLARGLLKKKITKKDLLSPISSLAS